MQARWGSEEDWTVLATNIAGHSFSDTLYRAAGQDTLFVGVRGNAYVILDTVLYVGIGDLFVVAGQSNASGRGDNLQSYSHPTLKAGLFGNDYRWKELTDPTDDVTNQVDQVSAIDIYASGSLWPIIADSIMANYDIPIGLIPCAAGGSNIAEWQAATDSLDRETLYGSMHFRVDSCGGAKAILWFQGEDDASVCMASATYNSYFDAFADSAYSDVGVKTMPCLLHDAGSKIDSCLERIRVGTSQAWGDNPHVFEGPDFSSIATTGSHLLINADIDSAANRWWRKIRDNIYEAP